MANLGLAFQAIAADIKDLLANKIALINGMLPLSLMPPGYTHSISLDEARTYASRNDVTPRTNIRLAIYGGNGDASWPNPWYTRGWDEWTWLPGVDRRGAVCKASLANSASYYPAVVIPAATKVGDVGFLFLSRASSTSTTYVAQTGWTFLTTNTGATNGIVDVYTRTMVDADAGVTLTPVFAGNYQRLATSLVVYGGVKAVVAPTANVTQSATASTTHVTPILTATDAAGVIWLTFVGERNSTPADYTPPPGTSIIATDKLAGSGNWVVALADSGSNYYPAGSFGGGVWTTTSSVATVATYSIGLVPTTQ